VTDPITLAAHAKINISLRILGKRPDGFHALETLMVPIALADEIELSHGSGKAITLTCNDPELSAGPENLCMKAAEAFRAETGLDHGIAITLLKKIPHGAGLGGGSSDAAFVLNGLNQLFDHPLVAEELAQIAATLGSDVPFFLENRPAWCRGRGEIIEPPPTLPARTLLLIKPAFPVPTAWAYKKYAEMKESGELPTHADRQLLGDLEIINDLEIPVFDKYLLLPVIKKWLQEQPEVECAFMTGSGSTMVAVIKSDVPVEAINKFKGDLSGKFSRTLWMTLTEFQF
jgi:4-diphosphocytidyl-2-C-methyl-D-erythritol kinase